MRIIKMGRKPNCYVRIICKNCEAELEINRMDLKETVDEPSRPTLYECHCACCNEALYFTKSELPEIFKN